VRARVRERERFLFDEKGIHYHKEGKANLAQRKGRDRASKTEQIYGVAARGEEAEEEGGGRLERRHREGDEEGERNLLGRSTGMGRGRGRRVALAMAWPMRSGIWRSILRSVPSGRGIRQIASLAVQCRQVYCLVEMAPSAPSWRPPRQRGEFDGFPGRSSGRRP
jgi:hypothetical protein